MTHTSTARRELIERLVVVQHCPGNEHVDIMTIAGVMTNEQVETHLAYYESKELERQLRLSYRRLTGAAK